ncbi:nucleoside phosphorylase [Haladaptatus sp. F3-133]|mgnify:CR=1 FL=1|jgi:uridine phosphorylase|uniref:Nucleoside phosphorylase n=1 Tax=Halorutilus salinus TaxID=2487751 RepID=A0A9Q4GGG7_9EURY|nr:nucleoside phosphorylase [Halorutilus salinus]MCX2818677.1 nucleoside phosphorylase [Halorutilus salinus]
MKQPHILVEEGAVNGTVLLPGDPGRVDRIAQYLDGVEHLSDNREYRLVNGSYNGSPLTVCSTGVGCPSAAVAVEELANVGAERLVRVGTAGGLQSEMNTGDIVVATAAAKFDGTTERYENVEYPAVASLGIVNSLVNTAEREGQDVHVGPVVTDDAFYAEDEIAFDWEEARMLAVEMEAAAIFTLARRLGLEAGGILAVDGNLVAGEQKGETEDDELSEEAKQGVEREVRVALEAVQDM